MEKKNHITDLAALRQRAEEHLQKKKAEVNLPLSEAEMLKTIHELEVHEIELEMQSDAFRLIKEHEEETLFKLNACFLKFGADPVANINLLAALCGELMGANFALYNSLRNDMLCSLGQWNTPFGYQSIDQAEGHLCNDVIKSTGETTTVIRNLQDTPYILTDPNVNLYNLKTYIGKAVKFNNTNIGSLCVVFRNDFIPNDNQLRLMGIIATAIGVEEDRRLAGEAMKASEEKYRSMFANNPQPMWIFDIETLAFLEVNDAAINLYGYSEKEFLSMTIMDIRPAGDIPELLKYLEPTDLKFKELGEFRHVRKNGEVIIVQITWHSVVSHNRKARHVLVNDITARKLIETSEKEMHDRLLKIAGQLPGVVYQLRLRPDGSFCFPFASETMVDYFSIRPDEIREDASKIFALIHPDDRAGMFASLETSAKELSLWQNEFRSKLGDGVYHVLFGNALPQLERDGSVIWHGFMSDTTERKRAEKALQDSETNLTAVLTATDESILVVSVDNTLLALNKIAAQRMGRPSKELIGRNVTDLLPPEVIANRIPYINRLLATREPVKFEDERDGKWMINYIYPILNAENQVIRLAIFSRDITWRKQAENALMIQNDYLSKLTQFSIDLAKLSSDDNLEAFIPKRIKEITGAVAATYSEYDEQSRMIVPKHIELEPGLLKKVVNLFGNQVQKIQSPVNETVYKEITSSIVGKLNSLTEASFGAIPKTVGSMVSKLIKAERYIAMVFLIEEKLYGTSLLAMGKHQPDPPIEILRNIAYMVAVSLRRKRAEVLQKETLDRLLKIAGQLPGVVYQFRLYPDGHCCFPFASEASYDLFGIRQNEVSEDALKAFSLLQPDVYKSVMNSIQKSAKDLTLFQLEIPVRLRDDAIHTLFASATPQPEDEGAVLWHGFISDITEHKRAKEELLEARRFTEEIINVIPVRVFWKDKNLNYMGCNKVFSRDAGFDDPKEIIGKDDYSMGWRDQAELYRSDDRKVIESGLPKLLIEEVQTTPDGNTITLLTNKIPLQNHKGEIIGILGTYMDITQRKNDEETLIASETRYRRLFESAKDGILILDAQTGKIVDVNPFLYKLLGFTEAQLLDREIWEIGLFKDIAANQAKFLELQKQKYVRYDDLPLETIDGRKINVEFVSNVYLADGKNVIQCNIRDITARKQVESQLQIKHLQLQKLNSEKDKFFSIIAHDLRSPFNGFLGLTEILASDLSDMTPEEIKKMALLMKNSATNLFGLLGNLLEWSRMQRGLTAFTPTSFLLMPKIFESMVLVNDAADKKDILICYAVPEDLTVFADTNMLSGIIRNLVTNAVKFTPKGGSIIVAARPVSNSMAEISVSDTGIGMNKELIDHLFRLDINTSRKGTEGEYSTGLGLLICKDFIEKNGGELHIESTEGKGSDFRFTVPIE